MECPVDNTVLHMTERNGVEIDYCPQCRGVWLDRGELDKIIDRASQVTSAAVPAPPPELRQDRDQGGYRDDRYADDSQRQPVKKKRKESFLGDLFDF